MDATSVLIEITKDKTLIHIDGELIGCVQRLNVAVDAEASGPVVTMDYWRKVGTVVPLKASDLLQNYSGTYGAYVTPFTNNLELMSETITLVEEDE